MLRSFKLVIFICISFVANFCWAASAVTCPEWEKIKPKVDNLKRIVGCESQFTSPECRENSGFGPKIGLAGAAVGSIAGRNVQLKAPAVCGIFKSTNYSIWENVAWASCNQQLESGARSVKDALLASNQVRDAELGSYLTEKLAKENPELDRLGKSVAGTFTANDQSTLASRVKLLNEKLAPLGVVVKDLANCTGNSEICAKLMSLAYAASPVDAKAKIAGNAWRLAEYYKYDNKVMSYNSAVRDSGELARRVEKGLIKSEGELEDLFRRAASVIHPSAKGLLANAGNYISSIVPALGKKGLMAEAGTLAKASAEYLAKHAGVLKKILPFGLAGLIGVATGANASEIAEGFLPPGAGVTTLGCESMSKYAPEHEERGVCRPDSKLTPVMKDFLFTPDDEQQTIYCQTPSLAKAINILNSNYFPPSMDLKCDGSKMTIKSDFKANQFFAEFSFQGDDILTSQVRADGLDGFKGYKFNFDPATGTVANGMIMTSGRTFMPIKPGVSTGNVALAGEDFAHRQMLAFAGHSCCQGMSDSCRYFKSSEGAAKGQGSDGTAAAGTK